MSEIIKNAIKELQWRGKEDHEGSLIDLAVLLNKIVKEFEHKGIQYVLKKYGPERIAQPN
jgi:hypothetical protein